MRRQEGRLGQAFQKQLENVGVDAMSNSNPEAALYIGSEIAKWEPIIMASGLDEVAVIAPARVEMDEYVKQAVATSNSVVRNTGCSVSRSQGWAPKLRPTQQITVCYLVCRGSARWYRGPDSVSETHIRDPHLAFLMAKTPVSVDMVITAQHSQSAPSGITVRLKNGSKLVDEVRYPKGHHLNPMNDAEVKEKFQDYSVLW